MQYANPAKKEFISQHYIIYLIYNLADRISFGYLEPSQLLYIVPHLKEFSKNCMIFCVYYAKNEKIDY